MMLYLFDDYGRFAGTSDTQTERSTTVEPSEHSPNYFWNHVNWVNAPQSRSSPNVGVAAPVRLISKLAFINRFAEPEVQAIYAAAKESTAVEVWLAKFNFTSTNQDGSSIDLDDPRTIDGVCALESAGLIGEGRAKEILQG